MDSEIRGILRGRKGGEWRRGKVEMAETAAKWGERKEKKTRKGGKFFGLRINMWREVVSPNIIINFQNCSLCFCYPLNMEKINILKIK